jgi:DNA gyrase/topoisomerase IV subunit A
MKKKTEIEKEKIIKLPVSKLIDTEFRNYAIYILESRGIPSFYDALIPVQRFILKNTNLGFEKTLGVVGRCMLDHYHHGDSLPGSLAKLARPFGNSLDIGEGYGFFGNEVSPDPAAPRYTQVKLSKLVHEILKKYNYLNTREEEGNYDPFWLDFPLGLTTPIIGIAIGYKTTILPRKMEDIKDFLDGKIKNVTPYFKNFNGLIEKFQGLDKTWLISSHLDIDNKRIKISEIAPFIKYATVLKKINSLHNKYENKIKIINNSNKKVDIEIVYNGKSTNEFNEICEYLKKIFSILVTENIVFIKDKQVLVYDSIEQYLEDWKWQTKRLHYFNNKWEKEFLEQELIFNQYKKLFIEFMTQKKRNNKEIDEFYNELKDKEHIERLERLTSRKFTTEEIEQTIKLIHKLGEDLTKKTKELEKTQKIFESVSDPTVNRSIQSKRTTTNLFDDDDVTEINGFMVWDGEDVYEDAIQISELELEVEE